MMRALLGLCALCVGCAFDDSDYTDFESASELELSDFSPEGGSDYFELRRGIDLDAPESGESTIYQFDLEALDALPVEDREALDATSSDRGFVTWCLPGDCGVYAVSTADSVVTVADSDATLLAFLGSLDTPAEVWLWLLAQELEAVRFLEEDSGDWLVLTKDDDNCGTVKTVLLFVERDGTITEERKIKVREHEGCA